jgi:N-acetylmuramoyl-L-alanine amidase
MRHTDPPAGPRRRQLLCAALAAPAAAVLQAGLGAGLLGGLTGCATPAAETPALDTGHPALGQDSRAQFLILHFTAESMADSLRILTQQAVSAHYLVGDQTPPVVYRLVDEARRAWHAGDSAWQGHTMLNASSIGVEIVNPGPRTLPDGSRVFAPFAPAQIAALIPLLQGIQARHGIRPDRVLGHSDIAPQRKLDPGPMFPWPALANAGLLPWPDAAQIRLHSAVLQRRYPDTLPDPAWWQDLLAQVGYSVARHGQLDKATRNVIAAFQMKYRPASFDGLPDRETAVWLQAVAAGDPSPATAAATRHTGRASAAVPAARQG